MEFRVYRVLAKSRQLFVQDRFYLFISFTVSFAVSFMIFISSVMLICNHGVVNRVVVLFYDTVIYARGGECPHRKYDGGNLAV